MSGDLQHDVPMFSCCAVEKIIPNLFIYLQCDFIIVGLKVLSWFTCYLALS